MVNSSCAQTHTLDWTDAEIELNIWQPTIRFYMENTIALDQTQAELLHCRGKP